MYKLVVLFAVVAIAVAKPSGWLGSPVVEAYSAPAIAVPAAVSSTYRKDVIREPTIVAYSAPTLVETPVVPISAAATHSFRSDFISEPVVVAQEYPTFVAKQAPTFVAEPVWPGAASYHPW